MAARDDRRFAEFVAARQHRLRRAAYLLTSDWETAADVTQEALVRVYLAWPRLDPDRGVMAYAHRALVSSTIDMSRRRGTRERHERRVAPGEAVADGAEQRATQDVVHQALTTLPRRQRLAVVLRYFDELSVAETAAAMRCSEGNVKSQTARGLDAMRRALADLGEPLADASLARVEQHEQHEQRDQEVGER